MLKIFACGALYMLKIFACGALYRLKIFACGALYRHKIFACGALVYNCANCYNSFVGLHPFLIHGPGVKCKVFNTTFAFRLFSDFPGMPPWGVPPWGVRWKLKPNFGWVRTGYLPTGNKRANQRNQDNQAKQANQGNQDNQAKQANQGNQDNQAKQANEGNPQNRLVSTPARGFKDST